MLLLLALACTPDDTGKPTTRDGRPGEDTGGDDTNIPEAEGCRSAANVEADRDRPVLVSFPYDTDANAADVWAVLTLTSDGELVDDGKRITMGRATAGEVTFTPDGSLALAVTERGQLAVYDVVNDVVVESAWEGGFYASRIVGDPSGEFAWIVDENWANNGGGLYRVALDCETGAPSGAERLIEAKLPADLVWADGAAILVGREVPGGAAGDDFARMDWPGGGAAPVFRDGADAFGDDEALVTDAAVAGEWLLVGDNNEFSGIATRIARVHMTADALHPAGTVEIEDPMSIVPFPDGSARALVASGYGDALFVLDVDGGVTQQVDATRVQLPNAMVAVQRGSLAGMTLVSEVGGIRRVQLGDTAEDLGVMGFGAGLDALPGAVGVAP